MRLYDGLWPDGKRNGRIEMPWVRRGYETLSSGVDRFLGHAGAQGADEVGFTQRQVELKLVVRLADYGSHRAPHRRKKGASERRTRTSCLPVRGPLGVTPFST
jgi:hypothetical protein